MNNILPQFKQRSDMHWARKVWHMLGVFIIFLAYMWLSETAAMYAMAFLAITSLGLDFLRLKNENVNRILLSTFKPIMRQYEVYSFAGTSFLFVGVLLVMVSFPKSVVGLTLLILAFADPIASIVGIKYGKDKIFFHKSLQGFMAAMLVCAILTCVYLLYFGVPTRRVLIISVLCGLVGAIAELVPVWKLDDNFTLPVLSGMGISIIFYFFDINMLLVV